MNPSIPGPDFLGESATIIFSPLTTAIVLLFFGKWLHSRKIFGFKTNAWAGIIGTAAMGRAFLGAIFMFLDLHSQPEHARSISVHLFDWISVGGFHVGADFLVDELSAIMVLVVTGVGTLIHLYSIGYMRDDPRFPRFFVYMNLFAFSMLLLVLADNLLLLYVGWEGVGLCSYLLIGFWFERKTASDAAKKAFLVNRIGDFSFLLGILLLAVTVGGLGLGQINDAAGGMTAGIATLAALLLLGGATGKSAQIPLYVWLPDAMEGPTPASALIHAATMVTAGVYLVARLHPVFEASGGLALTVVAWVGALTALWAALMAATEYDIKRVLAYSTVSQLGYMFLANGVGAYSAGIFHLITHAFFKALMFMGAGSVMHSLGGETDMRKMGGLRKIMPITGLTFMAGWLAISGIVPFSGFFSKDAILASAWHEGQYILWAIGVFTAFLTAFYMSRLYLRVFEGEVKVPEGVHAHESPWTMTVPLVALAVGAVGAGVINLPGSLWLEHFLEPALGETAVPEGLVPWILGGAALLVAFAGIALARFFYLTERGTDLRGRLRRGSWLDRFIEVARNKFYVDELYGRAFVLPGKDLANFAAYSIDARVIDGVVNGSGWFIGGSSEGLRRVQTGYVRNYAAIFLLGVVLVLSALAARIGLS
ncbi:MAG: NADH-quinone oxidoreductase subunit [Actinomycetota bacterium]|nr:NADH-quinone oxidoreductase subunit [Actinomycetota bacterium]